MGEIVEEIRRAYATVGITLDAPAAYGTYYRLLGCPCGHQSERTRQLDARRWQAARQRFAG